MPWDPWMTVAALGTFGGLIGTVFPSGMDVPLPGPLKDLIGTNTKGLIAFHLIRNLISGGLASVAAWMLYAPIVDPLVGRLLTEQMMVGSVITGGAGAAILSSLFAGQAKDRVIASLSDQVE